jgi:heptaprenyl diphosphate synthase
VAAGGKRLRPTLTLCAAYAAQGVEAASAAAVTGSVSCELVHLGSLYHDDVIDEAETRRSVPSVNARWSNIVAILAGDYLLAQASSLAASLGAEVAGLLADTIGELCRGQVLELQYLFDADRNEESYLSAIEGKTAALFATSCRIGGMVAGVSDETLAGLTQFGHHLGMCFQIVDDVLDVTQSDEELGKPAGNDLREGVYTLPVIRALKESDELRKMLGRAIDWPDVAKARSIVAANASATLLAGAYLLGKRPGLWGRLFTRTRPRRLAAKSHPHARLDKHGIR